MILNFIAFVLLLIGSNGDCNQINTVRDGLDRSNSIVALDQYINKYSKQCASYQPYMAIATMKKAEYESSLTKKIKYFQTGKAMLENYIEKYPNDIEARYLRYMVQKKAPKFVGYYQNMDSDKSYVLTKIANANLPTDYKQEMKQNLK